MYYMYVYIYMYIYACIFAYIVYTYIYIYIHTIYCPWIFTLCGKTAGNLCLVGNALGNVCSSKCHNALVILLLKRSLEMRHFY